MVLTTTAFLAPEGHHVNLRSSPGTFDPGGALLHTVREEPARTRRGYMSSESMPAGLAEAMAENEVPPDPYILQKVRDAARKLRDAEMKVNELTATLSEAKAEVNRLATKELVDLFAQAKIPAISLDAEGNYPPYDLSVHQYYKAAIKEENADEACEWLEKAGHGDVIKTIITVDFGAGEVEESKKLEKLLEKNKWAYSVKESVHAWTLTALVRRELEAGRVIPMDLLGAYTGQIVTSKPRKEKKAKKGK